MACKIEDKRSQFKNATNVEGQLVFLAASGYVTRTLQIGVKNADGNVAYFDDVQNSDQFDCLKEYLFNGTPIKLAIAENTYIHEYVYSTTQIVYME